MLRTKAATPPSSAQSLAGSRSYWPIEKNAEASPALAQASERPGGRPKGTDEVPPVLDGPGIVRSSVRVARLEVQDNAGGVGQS